MEPKFKRLDPTDRCYSILRSAVDAAEQHGYRAITRHQVAKYANCSPALVSKYYISMDLLRNAVMAHAVRAENLRILAQGLADGNPLAVGASKALKHAALTRLA